jgi:UDP-glucuronate decarboxylase
MKTNVLGAINVLNIAEKNNCPIFQASTSEVYGDPTEFPQKENYWGNVNPDGIRSCYDEGKRAAETIFMDYYRSHQTKIKIARIFNVYGPGMRSDDGRLISNLINQAIRNEPMTIYGDGMQTRSLCYIDDLLDGIIRLINTSDDVTGPVNLGNPDEKTILEIAAIIKEITGCKSGIKYCPLN